MELLAIVKAALVVFALGTGTTALGPNEQPTLPERVAVTNDAGDVLYYNFK